MKSLSSALAWRLAQAGMVAILVGVLSFAMMRALPGDMIFRIAAARFGYDNVTAENAELVRSQIGDPAGITAFFGWIFGLFRGDLGTSLVTGEAVAAEIAHQFGATAQLAGVAILLSSPDRSAAGALGRAAAGVACSTAPHLSWPRCSRLCRSSCWGWC